jgi:hypothetical protein
MHANYGRLFEPALVRNAPNPRHLAKADYLQLGRAAARAVAVANGAPHISVSFPDEATIAPVRVRVAVRETVEVGRKRARILVDAEAELGPGAQVGFAQGGGYDGPLAYRQGKPMRPDVAQAFDRMEQAARADGVALQINSGFRSDAEQAVLFARNPDPRMVAPPGKSLHRNGTELDIGPPAAYGWLAANARRFHFLQRYHWEPWHYETRQHSMKRRTVLPFDPGGTGLKSAREKGRDPVTKSLAVALEGTIAMEERVWPRTSDSPQQEPTPHSEASRLTQTSMR